MEPRKTSPSLQETPMKTASDSAVESLARTAVAAATKAAGIYLRQHNMEPDYDVLSERLRFHVKKDLDQAIVDSRDAIACGMQDAAMQTFLASMYLAGIKAAKETGTPK